MCQCWVFVCHYESLVIASYCKFFSALPHACNASLQNSLRSDARVSDASIPATMEAARAALAEADAEITASGIRCVKTAAESQSDVSSRSSAVNLPALCSLHVTQPQSLLRGGAAAMSLSVTKELRGLVESVGKTFSR